MRRLTRHAACGDWPADAAIATVTLDYEGRHRRRIRLDLDGGGAALLDLDRAIALGAGDGLQSETGEWIEVIAAPEPVLEIGAREARLRMRVAWHLGNRHVPAEISADWIRIRPDHVLRDMLLGLGAEVTEIVAAFQPERGAYEGPRAPSAQLASDHHPHRHAHAQGEPHAHAHPHEPADEHDHGAA